MDPFYVQAILIVIILFSLFFYSFTTYGSESVLVNPTIEKMSFYRDYLFLTILPYIYYVNDNKYQDHYILNHLDSNAYFVYAGINASVFMMLFLLVYRVISPPMARSFSKMTGTFSIYTYTYLLMTLLPIFVAYFIYISIQYKAGVWGLINGNMAEINEGRHILSRGTGILALNKIFVQSWIPILAYTLFYINLKYKISRLMVLFSFVLGCLASVYFFEKSTLFFFLLGYVAVYLYAGNKISVATIAVTFLIAIAVVSLMYVVTYGDRISGIDYLLEIIIHRTATQSVGSVMALHYFYSHDYFYFSGVSNLLASITGGSFQSVYSALIAYYDPENADISGALSSFAAGDAYGLFGYLGIILGGIVVGVFYAFLESSKYSKNLSLLFVGVYGVYYSHFYIASSFYGFLWPIGLLYDMAPFLLIFVVSKIRGATLSDIGRIA